MEFWLSLVIFVTYVVTSNNSINPNSDRSSVSTMTSAKEGNLLLISQRNDWTPREAGLSKIKAITKLSSRVEALLSRKILKKQL